MSSKVVPFPKKPPLPPDPAAEGPSTAERLSEEFLHRAVAMHMAGEAGVDVYRGMIMALTKLICHAESDPAVIDRRLAASHAHIMEARDLLTGSDGRARR